MLAKQFWLTTARLSVVDPRIGGAAVDDTMSLAPLATGNPRPVWSVGHIILICNCRNINVRPRQRAATHGGPSFQYVVGCRKTVLNTTELIATTLETSYLPNDK